MAYGTQQGSDYTYFKIEGLKQGSTELYFKGQRKGADGYEDIPEKPTFLEGHLSSVETSTFEYQGKSVDTVKIIFKDGEDSYLLEGGYSMMMVGLINGMLGAESLGKLNLSLYFSKGDKGSFPTMMAKHGSSNGEKLSWDVPYDKIKKMIKVTDLGGGEMHHNKTKLIEYLKKRVEEELPSKIQTYVAPEVTTPTIDESTPVEIETETGESELPF